ncbi:MAG: 6-phosphogluconolactonase [Lentisphaeria bacterium]|nr:6-phosphogluconolactonase [Lentisphaeria bacterium]NQZ67511.1 6-phosphogluconolactonase [Lentisphaeria bacterium]
MQFKVFNSNDAIENAVYDLLVSTLTKKADQAFGLMIAGGSTPLKIYKRIAESTEKASSYAHLIFSDDRHVSSDSPDSNLGNCSPMIEQLEIAKDQLIAVNADLSLNDAADEFHSEIERFLVSGDIDLAVIGMGADGHTCSIFSLEAAEITDTLAFPVEAQGGFNRVSVSRPVLEKVKRIIFLVTGEGKKDVLTQFKENPQQFPSGMAVRNCENVEIWTDQLIN